MRRRLLLNGGVTLLEVLAVAAILGMLAALAIAAYSAPHDDAKRNACHTHCGEIEIQTQLWFRQKGAWPAGDLSDIGADAAYFPSGLPVCPVDGSSYSLDPTTHRVVGHDH